MKAQLTASQDDLLRQAGQLTGQMGMSAYLVGGSVRDMLLRRPSTDLDVVVEGDGLQFAAALAGRLGLSHSAHERFLTAIVRLPDGGQLDVATARRENYPSPGALPVVEPATVDEDLWRRDFAINAMAVALDEANLGQLRDPCGGYSDLEAGVVRLLHDDSFRDDPTRIIRAVEFVVRFGFDLEPHTKDLLVLAVKDGALGTVSPERLREVLLPVLESALAVRSIVRLGELGVLAALGLLGTVTDQLRSALEQIPEGLTVLGSEGSSPEAALVYLSLLAHAAGTDARTVAAQIQLSSDEQRAVDNAVKFLSQPPTALSVPEVKPSELYFALERLTLIGAVALWARLDSPVARARIEEFWRHLRHIKPDIDGDHLIQAGTEPGPQFAEGLQAALRLKLDDPQATPAQQVEAALTHVVSNAKKA